MTMGWKMTAVALVLLASNDARAADGTITVEQVWARATPGAGSTGAVYLTVTDHGGADRLIGLSTPAASMAMIHESYTEGGISKMRMLDGVALDADKPVSFQPGTLHIMLEGLQAPLRVGGAFPLTLTFEKSPPQTVPVMVVKPGAPGPGSEEGKDMPGMKMP